MYVYGSVYAQPILSTSARRQRYGERPQIKLLGT